MHPRVSLATVILILLIAMGLVLTPVTHGQRKMRLNKMVALLEEGKTVFGSFVNSGSGPEGAVQAAGNSETDFVFYDMEHSPFDVTQLRIFVQFMLNPAAILKAGNPSTDHPVIVRIPAYGREMNQWMIKNVLDQGARGIIVPHTETPEQALNIIRAMRYPQSPGVPDFEPEGLRGSGPGFAARLWGVSTREYMAKADLWPLDPDGEMLAIFLIENQLGVKNVREIARRAKGTGILFAGPGDLGVSYAGDGQAVENAIQTILAAAKEFNMPCAITAGPTDVEKRIREGFHVIVTSGQALTIGRKAAGR